MQLRCKCRKLLALGAGVLLVASAADAQIPESRKRGLGDRFAAEFRRRHGVVRAPAAQEYLEGIVSHLLELQPGADACCRVEIHNAGAAAPYWPYASPGGFVFVPARRFLSAAGEQDFVWRLAHAVAHARSEDWLASDGMVRPRTTIYFAAPCGHPSSVPIRLRQAYGDRERRADEAATDLIGLLQLGSGQFEAARSQIEAMIGRTPPKAPVGRPSLLP